jgi:hypothetical protein
VSCVKSPTIEINFLLPGIMLFHTSEESTKEFEKNVKIWFILLWKT